VRTGERVSGRNVLNQNRFLGFVAWGRSALRALSRPKRGFESRWGRHDSWSARYPDEQATDRSFPFKPVRPPVRREPERFQRALLARVPCVLHVSRQQGAPVVDVFADLGFDCLSLRTHGSPPGTVENRGLVTAADPTGSDPVTGLPDRNPMGGTCHEPMFADLVQTWASTPAAQQRTLHLSFSSIRGTISGTTDSARVNAVIFHGAVFGESDNQGISTAHATATCSCGFLVSPATRRLSARHRALRGRWHHTDARDPSMMCSPRATMRQLTGPASPPR
jgi:hypothetical protein